MDPYLLSRCEDYIYGMKYYVSDNRFLLYSLSQQKRPNHAVERLPPAKFSRGLVTNENCIGDGAYQTVADKSFRSLPNSSTQQRKYLSTVQ